MNNKSFTLIELLVVIAIIGLIASVVLVTIGGGGLQSKARIGKTLEFSQSIQSVLGAYAVGVWGFDQGSGTSALDGSGFGNNGTLGNGACTPGTGSCPSWSSDTPHSAAGASATGKFSLSFDGTDDYVNAGNGANLSVTGAFTVEAWIKTNVVGAGTGGVVFSRYGGAPLNGYELRFEGFGDGRMTMITVVDGSWVTTKEISGTITAGKWYHITGTYNGTLLKLYVNGIFQSQINSSAPKSVTANAIIGRRTSLDGTPHVFNGLIDEVRVYEAALSLGQIQQHYVEGLNRHQNLAIK